MVHELLKDFIMEKYRRRWVFRRDLDPAGTVLNFKGTVTLSGQAEVHFFLLLPSEIRRSIKSRNQLNFEVNHTRFR